jgi:hypothetical protein
MGFRRAASDVTPRADTPPSPGAAVSSRLGIALRLFAILLIGSLVMAASAGGIFLGASVDPYQRPLNFSNADVRNDYLIAWLFCAVGLVVVALLCLWRRSRGHRSWRYSGTLGVAFMAMLVVWFFPSFTMGLNTPRTGGTLIGNIGMALVMWLLTSFYAMFFNVANLLLVVPATVEAWYAVLNRGTPHEDPRRAVRKRRAWLYGLAVASLVLVGWIGQ